MDIFEETPATPPSPSVMSPLDQTSNEDTPASSNSTPNMSRPASVDLELDENPPNTRVRDENNSSGGTMIIGDSTNKTTSKYWEGFTRVTIEGKLKAKCKQCGRAFVGDPKQGTRYLKNHLLRCPKKKAADISQQILQDSFNKDKFQLGPSNFDQDQTRKDLARMIIMYEYPLKMVEHEGFKKFVRSLNPMFKLMSRNTVRNDCVKLYEDMKEIVMQIFESNDSRVAITTDMWTSSHQKKGFMVVTAHYIDNDWILQSRIIRFVYVPCPHTSEVLCEALIECLLDWNLDRNLSTITMDNCSTNGAMVDLLLEKTSDRRYVACWEVDPYAMLCTYSELVCERRLGSHGGAVEKVRDCVSYWSGTPKRWEKFEETARQLRIPIGKKLMLDCKTRWNSTYLMLKIALDYKNVFFRLKHRDPKYKCVPSEEDWSLTKEICSRLQLFYNVTDIFSGTKYPTANLYFPKICEIKLALNQWMICGVEVVESMARNIDKKFEKYWSSVHGIMGVATVLDPQYKVFLLEYYFPKINPTEAEIEVEKILTLCCDLLRQYETKDNKKGTGDMSCHFNETNLGIDSSLSEFHRFASQRKRKSVMLELDHYLDEDVLPRTPDFDILTWWKANKGKYPILHQIARDVLAIPVSTVASESAFSASGRLISPHRSRLLPKTVEALMRGRNWILSECTNVDHLLSGALESIFYDSDDEKIDLDS